MTNEEAKVFLDNLKICINEHPIVADWLVEIADRKTEPHTEKLPLDIVFEMALAKCKTKHKGCENCDMDCMWRDKPQTLKCFKADKYKSCEYVGKCDNHICLKALSEGEKRAKTEPQTERSRE